MAADAERLREGAADERPRAGSDALEIEAPDFLVVSSFLLGSSYA
jgi:hypothetical protein